MLLLARYTRSAAIMLTHVLERYVQLVVTVWLYMIKSGSGFACNDKTYKFGRHLFV